MSVESEILRIQHNIASAYAAVAGKGGIVPLQPTSENLAAAVVSIPAGNGSGDEVYSTEEQRIGTWIDGRPLYRRTLTGTFSSSEEVILNNVDVCANANGFLGIGGSTNSDLMVPYMSKGGYASIYVNRSTHALILYSAYSNCIGQRFAITAEYTKAADEPVETG